VGVIVGVPAPVVGELAVFVGTAACVAVTWLVLPLAGTALNVAATAVAACSFTVEGVATDGRLHASMARIRLSAAKIFGFELIMVFLMET
jgi:hypothetical protein